MNGYILESLYVRLGRPAYFWPAVFAFVLLSFFLVDGIAALIGGK